MDRLFLWQRCVLCFNKSCYGTFRGDVADSFNLFVFHPTSGLCKLFKKKLCLTFAESGLFAEKTPLWLADSSRGWIALGGFLDFGAAQQLGGTFGAEGVRFFRYSSLHLYVSIVPMLRFKLKNFLYYCKYGQRSYFRTEGQTRTFFSKGLDKHKALSHAMFVRQSNQASWSLHVRCHRVYA